MYNELKLDIPFDIEYDEEAKIESLFKSFNFHFLTEENHIKKIINYCKVNRYISGKI